MEKVKKINCSKCGKPKESHRIKNESYCLACHAERMRKSRPKHKDLPKEQRLKENARAYLNVYIRRGKIMRQTCQECGSKAQAHHPDYTKPLEVIWLCRKHHLELHKNETTTRKN